MRMAEDNDRELIIQESLKLSMLRPALLIIVSIFTILGPLDAIYQKDERLFWTACLVFSIGILSASVGGFILLLMPFCTSIVDQEQHHIIISHNKWNLMRGSARCIAFSDVQNIEIILQKNEKDHPLYKVQLVLVNGEQIPLTSRWEQDRLVCNQVRSELSLWLRLKYH